ncbi:MAG: LytTR family DNA-binding domain-containing protein [Saprospiraceae bacterium]|nr:response regulator transcription factor [Lewinella sp.]
MTSIIIDDEPHCREGLISLLTYLHPELDILGVADGVQSGIELILAKQPDLLFLDIKMHDGTGFDLLERIDHTQFAIIFTTGYDEYACLAFDFAAMAYLKKPIASDKLATAILRAEERLQQQTQAQQLAELREITENFRRRQLPRRIAVSNSSGTFYIPVDQITFLTVDEGCTEIHQLNGQRVIVSANLIEYENHFLRYPQFMRVHKSYLANLEHVRAFHRDGEAILENGLRIPVSQKNSKELKDRLTSL